MSRPKLADALATAHVVFDKATLEAAIARMADVIVPVYADGDTPLFLTVMNGGLPFAAQLAFALGERGLDLPGRLRGRAVRAPAGELPVVDGQLQRGRLPADGRDDRGRARVRLPVHGTELLDLG